MNELREIEVALPGVSILIGTSQWVTPEDWICPADNYVVCQRLSYGHSALRLKAGNVSVREAYSHVHSLGFMPSTGCVRLYPLEQPLRTLNCFFDKDYFEASTEMDAKGWYECAGPFMTIASPFLETMMQRIYAELVQPGFGSEQVFEAASTMIAVEMARLGQQRLNSMSEANVTVRGLAPWQMRRIRDRLDASLEQGYPRIQELAQLCGISRGHLMRTFKASTGYPLHRYVAEERLGAATRMLAEEQLSIKEIAATLGFCNTGHFTTAFRRKAGMTPSDFRRRARTGRVDMAMWTSPDRAVRAPAVADAFTEGRSRPHPASELELPCIAGRRPALPIKKSG
jgi:AraC family transcriptional regulator